MKPLNSFIARKIVARGFWRGTRTVTVNSAYSRSQLNITLGLMSLDWQTGPTGLDWNTGSMSSGWQTGPLGL